jgi:hypothetical protein
MYQSSVPVMIRMLGNLRAILEKATAQAEARKYDVTVLINSRLFPDMFPLSRQIQIATDMAKGCAARLSGTEPPPYADTEATMSELIARIDKTVTYLKTFKADQIDGSEARAIELKSPRGTMNFVGQQYLLNFVLPNLYFHLTTTYNILRHNGIEIGKMDFIGQQ